jgi:hypothetical protein
MQKFTVFTVILTVLVVVVVAEIAVNEYLPGEDTGDGTSEVSSTTPSGLNFGSSIETSVFSADGSGLSNYLGSDVAANDEPLIVPTAALDEASDIPTFSASSFVGSVELADTVLDISRGNTGAAGSASVGDFEDPGYISKATSVSLREEQLVSAGFVDAYIEDEDHGNKLFKTIPVGDLLNVNIDKKSVRSAESLMVKVYAFQFGFNADIDQAYQLIVGRAGQQVAVDINETNEFGQASFFMNDARREDIAFLTIKLPQTIYAFSYPKDYHQQVKNLIQLLEWELG